MSESIQAHLDPDLVAEIVHNDEANFRRLQPYALGMLAYSPEPSEEVTLMSSQKYDRTLIMNIADGQPAQELRPKSVTMQKQTMAHQYFKWTKNHYDYIRLREIINKMHLGQFAPTDNAGRRLTIHEIVNLYYASSWKVMYKMLMDAEINMLFNLLANKNGVIVENDIYNDAYDYVSMIPADNVMTMSSSVLNSNPLNWLYEFINNTSGDGDTIWMGRDIAQTILTNPYYSSISNSIRPYLQNFNYTPVGTNLELTALDAKKLILGFDFDIEVMMNKLYDSTGSAYQAFPANCVVFLKKSKIGEINSAPCYIFDEARTNQLNYYEAPMGVESDKSKAFKGESNYLVQLARPEDIYICQFETT
jgi:hypothetical protein